MTRQSLVIAVGTIVVALLTTAGAMRYAPPTGEQSENQRGHEESRTTSPTAQCQVTDTDEARGNATATAKHKPKAKDPDCDCGHASTLCPVHEFREALENYETPDTILIAIVPDPEHTHLGLFFDRQVETITEALQQFGYAFQHAEMPWNTKEPLESTDFVSNLRRDEFQVQKEKYPGVMTFHRTVGQSASLVVFVVGEQPTNGVNEQQFNNAMLWARRHRSHQQTSLPILGPTFSGSLSSLSRLVAGAASTFTAGITIHSGTATSRTLIDATQWPDKVTFRAFLDNDCNEVSRLEMFLVGRGYRSDEIALLTEQGTGYGAAETKCMPRKIRQVYFPRDISHLRSAYQHDIQDQSPSDPSSGSPAHLTLRENYSDPGHEDAVAPYSLSQTPLSQESVLLGIVSSLEKIGAKWIVIRATNPIDTLFLTRYLRGAYPWGRIITMSADLLFRRESTDPQLRGVLALTTYSLVPRIDAEMYEFRHQPASDIEHVFPSSESVATYNAILALPQIAGPDATPQGDRGTKALLLRRDYAQYGWPAIAGPPQGCRSTPPLWLVASGDVGYWPVALVEEQTSTLHGVELDNRRQPDCGLQTLAESLATENPSLQPPEDPLKRWRLSLPRQPSPWKVLQVLVSLVALSYLLLLRRGAADSPSQVLATFAPIAHKSRAKVLTWIVILIGMLIAAVLWPYVRWRNNVFMLSMTSVEFVALFLSGAMTLGKREAPYCQMVLTVIGAIGATAWSLAFLVDPSVIENMAIYRARHLTSGLSPLLPFLFLIASGLWRAWYSLTALAFLDDRRPLLPNDRDLSSSTDSVQQKVAPCLAKLSFRIASGLRRASYILTALVFLDDCGPNLPEGRDPLSTDSSQPHVAPRLAKLSENENVTLVNVMDPWNLDWRVGGFALVLTVAAIVPAFHSHPVQAFEPHWYEVVYGIALAIVLFGLLSSVLRAVLIWVEFRALLVTLDSLPLRRAFKALKGFSWRPMWRARGKPVIDSARFVGRLRETLEHLETLHAGLSGILSAEELGKLGVAATVRTGLPRQEVVEKFKGLRESVAKCAGHLLQRLEQQWRTEPSAKLAKGSLVANETKEAELYVALVYLNFILVVLTRVRTLVMCAAGTYVLLVLSFVSYPFDPRPTFQSMMIVLLFVIIGLVGLVFANMHRDNILSYITDTTPGELGVDFWIRLVSFAAVPVFSLLAVQVPAINAMLFSWLEPALRALR